MPDYDNPPVIETVIGVQFEQIAGFSNAHLGAFWKTLDTHAWPIVKDAPTLEPQFERFDQEASPSRARMNLRVTQSPATRLQIRNQDKDRMIQLQNNAFYFNWIKQSEGPYPRYERIRSEFLSSYRKFAEFLNANDLGEAAANQWEVTYVNHIPRGTIWETPQDWDFFDCLNSVPNIDDIAHGESFSGDWRFIIPENLGRLHVNWSHKIRREPEPQEVVVLTLTARGPLPTTSSNDPIDQGLGVGRKTIVNAFQNLMTERANRYWGLNNGSS